MPKHWFVAICLLLASPVLAQDAASPEADTSGDSTESTQLEEFAAQQGSVIIKGYSDIGDVESMGTVSVNALELRDATTGKNVYGITVTVTESGRLEREAQIYIDYDEIDDLLAGIDYVSQIDTDVTKFGSFEARYSTRGGLGVIAYSQASGKVAGCVEAGRIGPRRAFLSLDRVETLGLLIRRAKQYIDDNRIDEDE